MLLALRKKQNSEQSREGYGRRASGDRPADKAKKPRLNSNAYNIII